MNAKKYYFSETQFSDEARTADFISAFKFCSAIVSPA